MHSHKHRTVWKASNQFKERGSLHPLCLRRGTLAGPSLGSKNKDVTQDTWIWADVGVPQRGIELPVSQTQGVVVTSNRTANMCQCLMKDRQICHIPNGLHRQLRVSAPQCEIFFCDGSYRIKDIGSDKGTYKNGKILSVNETKKLKDGDIISLGRSICDPLFFEEAELSKQKWNNKIYPQTSVVLRFQAPILRTACTKKNSASTSSKTEDVPINSNSNNAEPNVELFPQMNRETNDELLSEILSYLTLEDLKNCRLVSRIWKNVAVKLFYPKIEVDVPGFGCPQWVYLRGNYNDYFSGSEITNAVMRYDDMSDDDDFFDSNRDLSKQKYLENFQWFVANFAKQLHDVTLNFDCKDWRLYLNTLRSLSAVENLKLILRTTVSKIEWDKLVKVPTKARLPAVKSLSFELSDIDEWENYLASGSSFMKRLVKLFKDFLKILPSLEKISLPLGGAPLFLKKITKQYPTIFNGIREFHIRFCEYDEVDLNHCFDSILTLQFPLNLRSLELDGIHSSNYKSLNTILQKFSPNLENLGLDIPDLVDYYSKNSVTGGFPTFPKLTHLRMIVLCYDQRPSQVQEQQNNEVMPEINYHVTFPKLHTLILRRRNSFGRQPITLFQNRSMEPLISPVDQVCSTLRRLELPSTWHKARDEDYRNWLQGLVHKFPNVNNSLFRIVRSGQFHLLRNDYSPRFEKQYYDREFFHDERYSSFYDDEDYYDFYHNDNCTSIESESDESECEETLENEVELDKSRDESNHEEDNGRSISSQEHGFHGFWRAQEVDDDDDDEDENEDSEDEEMMEDPELEESSEVDFDEENEMDFSDN